MNHTIVCTQSHCLFLTFCSLFFHTILFFFFFKWNFLIELFHHHCHRQQMGLVFTQRFVLSRSHTSRICFIPPIAVYSNERKHGRPWAPLSTIKFELQKKKTVNVLFSFVVFVRFLFYFYFRFLSQQPKNIPKSLLVSKWTKEGNYKMQEEGEKNQRLFSRSCRYFVWFTYRIVGRRARNTRTTELTLKTFFA